MSNGAFRKVALILEYDGTRYAGFQLQSNAPTIQGELERAIGKLAMTPARVYGAGRTDSGVHAKGQVAAFDTDSPLDCPALIRGLNHFLPEDVAVKGAYDVQATFDPRRHASSRLYTYTILNRDTPSPLWERYACRVAGYLDMEAMGTAMRCLEGEHDFALLGGPVAHGQSTVRNIINARLWQEGELVHYEIEGNAFLPHQMRRIAGLLVAIGKGRLSIDTVPGTLEGRVNPWRTGKVTSMPPHGLCLTQVKYKDFPPDGN